MRDHVLFAHCVFDVFFQELQIEQVRHAQSSAPHFVFIRRADSPGSGANLHAPRSVLRRQFDHAMVRQNHLCAVGDKKISIHTHAGIAQRSNFFQKGHRIEHDPVANHATAAGPQHSARNQLQYEFFAVDDDGVAGVMSASIARHDGEVFRQHVDDLSFALVAPLGADNYRGLASFHFQLRYRDSRPKVAPRHRTRGRTRLAADTRKANWDERREDVYQLSYRAHTTDSNAQARAAYDRLVEKRSFQIH